MPETLNMTELRNSLEQLGTDSDRYFEEALVSLSEVSRDEARWVGVSRDHFFARLPAALRDTASELVARVLRVAGQIIIALTNAPLVSAADQRDVMAGTKTLRSALFLRRYRSWDAEVLHDEGTVLGVQPSGQSDDEPCAPEDARRIFSDYKGKILSILDLVAASRALTGPEGAGFASDSAARYRPNTAFIMMWMDTAQGELQDVSDTVKDAFAQFDIRAIRADDIEHEGVITERILNEIGTAEFLFADLTGERPSVYYEVGYAHALRRRVILYRKAGTGLHFDLAGYNCPEYKNLHDLKEKLTRRLEHMIGRRPRGTAAGARETPEI